MALKHIKTTAGDSTLYNETLDETYHSRYGAIAESIHVFVEAGLARQLNSDIRILEIGFGTGLNALLSLLYALQHNISLQYDCLETEPLPYSLIGQLNYAEQLHQPDAQEWFTKLHKLQWDRKLAVNEHFNLHKMKMSLHEAQLEEEQYDLVYFDAFAPNKQADMWTLEVFRKLYASMKNGGILCTYSAAGIVKRALRSAGFKTEHPAGPHGKREMSIAFK